MSTIQLKRGQKLCPACQGINAARSAECKHCNYIFYERGIRKRLPNRKHKTEVCGKKLSWHELEKNDYVRIIKGSGPYYICSRETEGHKAGEKVCMGHTGVYKVIGKNKDGLMACGASHKNGGFVFLYMGDPYVSSNTGIHYMPYKFKKVIKKK